MLLTLLAVGVLGIAIISITRTTHSFYRLDFPVTWIETGVLVGQVPTGSSAQVAGLSDGDLIISVDQTSVSRLEDPLFVLATGKEHTLLVRDPDTAERSLTFSPPPPTVDSVYLSRSLVAAFALCCAAWAVLVTRRRESATFVLLAVASLLLASIPHRTATSAAGFELLYRMAGSSIPFLIIRFFAIFPRRRHSMRLWDLLTAVSVCAGVSMSLRPDLDAWWPATASILRVLFASGLLFGAVVCVRRWWAAARVARIRRQIEWVALGFFVGLLPFFSLVLLPRWLGFSFEPFSWVAILPIAAVPLGFLAALTEYRLWDLEPISRDSISATVVVTAGGLVFLLTKYFLLRSAAIGPSSLRNLLAFPTGVLLVVLLQPVRLNVERFLDKWLHHGRPTPRWLLTHATRDLARATDPRKLLAHLSQTLHDGLEFEKVATYLRVGNGSFEKVTASEHSLPPRLPRSVLTSAYPHPEEQAFSRVGYALRIPLERGSIVHGLLYLGLHRGIFPLGSEGRSVVSAFAAQAALGLESARLLDDLRRQAEEYRILHSNTQRIIESSAAGILVCDAAGRVLSANLRAATILSEDTQVMVGMELQHLIDLPATWHPHLPLHAVNAEAQTTSEEHRRLIMAVSVLELDSGSFNGRVVVLQDVTELRNLQDKLREQERMAALGKLASGLAHEINTPLTGIASFAQMLGETTPQDDPRAELIAKLVQQSFRVSRIVANLHEAVRGSSLDRATLDLATLARDAAVETVGSLSANIDLVIDDGDGPIHVTGAPGPVELAVGNLVRNAVEASNGSGSVAVAVRANPPWGEVHVTDTGPGVPEPLRDRVFEPFFTTKGDRGGTGLGLAITRDMIAQLGGDVTMSFPPQGGTVAIVRLPLCQGKQQS